MVGASQASRSANKQQLEEQGQEQADFMITGVDHT